MKILKTLTCAFAAVAALAFCTPSAKAGIGIVTNYNTLNISLTINTNIAQTHSGSTYHDSYKSAHFVTKDLLNLLQTRDFANTNFPSGSKIVIGWDRPWYDAVLVVDKTGTNVLFNASSTNTAGYVIFVVEGGTGSYYGAYNETHVEANPGSDGWTEFYSDTFEIYDETNLDIDIHQIAPDKENFHINWNLDHVYLNWNDSENLILNTSENQVLNNASYVTATGNVQANGSGKGEPYYLY